MPQLKNMRRDSLRKAKRKQAKRKSRIADYSQKSNYRANDAVIKQHVSQNEN